MIYQWIIYMIYNYRHSKPTEIDKYGNKYWRNDKGLYHRIDGPAREWPSGRKEWYSNSKSHRMDGPAREYADGTKQWWINSRIITLHTLSNMMVYNEFI